MVDAYIYIYELCVVEQEENKLVLFSQHSIAFSGSCMLWPMLQASDIAVIKVFSIPPGFQCRK